MLNSKSASVQLITLPGHRFGVRLFPESSSAFLSNISLAQAIPLQSSSVSKFCRQCSHAPSVFNASRTLRHLQRQILTLLVNNGPPDLGNGHLDVMQEPEPGL